MTCKDNNMPMQQQHGYCQSSFYMSIYLKSGALLESVRSKSHVLKS
jgi:hypothetical protein